MLLRTLTTLPEGVLRTRILHLLILLPGLFAVILWNVTLRIDIFDTYYPILVPVSLLLGGASVAGLVLMYLQTGFRLRTSPTPFNDVAESDTEQFRSQLALLKTVSERLSRVEHRIAALEERDPSISIDERSEIVRTVRECIESKATDEFLEQIRASLEDRDVQETLSRDVIKMLNRTRRRLADEQSRTRRGGDVNLAIGSSTAVLGIAALFLFVESTQSFLGGTAPKGLIEGFLPRLSIVLIVEALAFFFLRLYSKSLKEIKFFQNEITNIDAQIASLTAAIHLWDKRTLEVMILNISQTERNPDVQNSQVVLESERPGYDRQATLSFFEDLFKIFRGKE